MNLNPRIWRSGDSDFYADEVLQADSVYTRETLTAIRDEGFDSIWLRGSLFDLMSSDVFPELNRPNAELRIRRIQELIERGKECGVGVWLFFNEPQALSGNHPFWQEHSELRGASHWELRQPDGSFPAVGDLQAMVNTEMVSLCMSAPLGREFFRDAVDGLLKQLEGLAGVILITASELHSHCWSHHVSRPTGDKFLPINEHELSCPRCRERGAAAVVLDLIEAWRTASLKMSPPCRVLAWNWSWSIWYPDPQIEIVGKLPEGVEMLVDCERGGTQAWQRRMIPIDEYSLAYVGPSERFCKTRQAAGAHPVHAKLQINTTHELASVPNLPLIPNLFEKWSGLRREGIAGAMGCWNFGCAATLNTYAFKFFHEQGSGWEDSTSFCRALAESYFGNVDGAALVEAWTWFCESFRHFPFNFGVLYHGLGNYAPAYPLDLTYRAEPMGLAHLFQNHWGDRLEDTLVDWTLEDVTSAWELMSNAWQKGIISCRRALGESCGDPLFDRHRREELSCAAMIGCHLASIRNIYRFHGWRLATMRRLGFDAPCTLTADDESRAIWRDEEANVRQALDLVEADSRLGYHGEAHAHLFDSTALRQKLHALAANLPEI